MTLEEMHERFMRDEWPVRMGNLGSSLGRLSNYAMRPAASATVAALLNECKCFIEWVALEAPPHAQRDLVQLQLELAPWGSLWRATSSNSAARALLSVRARLAAEHVLEWSGLLADNA